MTVLVKFFTKKLLNFHLIQTKRFLVSERVFSKKIYFKNQLLVILHSATIRNDNLSISPRKKKSTCKIRRVFHYKIYSRKIGTSITHEWKVPLLFHDLLLPYCLHQSKVNCKFFSKNYSLLLWWHKSLENTCEVMISINSGKVHAWPKTDSIPQTDSPQRTIPDFFYDHFYYIYDFPCFPNFSLNVDDSGQIFPSSINAVF